MSQIRLRTLYDLNVELLESLIIVSQQFLDYTKKHEIPIQGIARLSFLVGNAIKIMEQITYLEENTLISDASYHNHENRSSDDNLPEPLILGIYGSAPCN